ncbi:NAD(P)/FAD-dependent oxidoreductase [Amorphus orientalis]|uniref:Glycine/D-amino acid oxidase-like deaminating enzyme n=1 Tax=Amorphus orientalis TaxID=649198 RepID=A0AAE4ARG8_9HYPH|nr:FAD-dependent oxidoreductase [Amorphus orientalis]MDQ0314023.1 glycine/D-amino acid oxidase-like deaminating enzyme [Amorphus orientalis]
MSATLSFETAVRTPYWRETVPDAAPCPPPAGDIACDLAIIGGGFTGLWAALKARERWPDARIVLLEAGTCGNAASGRNGGFTAPSISHGVGNAVARWPKEAETLIWLGRENLDRMAADLDTYGIDGQFERAGKLTVAATPWQADGLKAMRDSYARFGIDCTLLEGDALKERFDSPKYPAGLFEPNYALVNPAMLVEGLKRACLKAGVEIHEEAPVTAIARDGAGVRLSLEAAVVSAKQAVMATNAAVSLIRRFRMAILPIFDYSLLTAPLTDAQLDTIGWRGRHGIADSGNQFHYFRKTADNRILWGGFDAIYHYGSSRDPALLHRPETYARLAATFNEAFPALADVPFTHAWGGIIDTSARTTFFAGTALGGVVAYALGFTGQGVSASRFAALAMLDMLEGRKTERTELRMLRSFAVPFPPEPLRSLAVRWAQRDLAAEDLTGRRSLFLRGLDRLGIGFAS